jgi:hypothetical protein
MSLATIGIDPGSTSNTRAITEAGGTLVPVSAQAFNNGSDQPTQVSTANPLPVIQTGTPGLPTGAATAAKQDTGNASLATLVTNSPALGQALAAASVPVILPSATITTLTPPSNTGYSTSAKQDTGNTSLGSIDTKLPSQGQALGAASIPVVLPVAQITTLTPPAAITGFATAAKQPALGTAGTASSDVITIQGIASMTKLLVTPDSVALPANQSVNVSQINGVTPLMGNGVTGTGSQRVTIASDNTAFSVNSTLSAETTKVIGVTRTADGAGNLLTSNSTTYTAKFGLDGNLLGTLGTAFSTAGKVDVKGADGDVFVRQATASNLNATVVGTGTFAVQATLAAETTKVIGTVNDKVADGDMVTLGAKADAKSTATDTTAVSAMSVLKEISYMEQNPASRAVTNSGTFAVQATPVTQADTFMLGGVNIKEINAVTPLMGAGNTGTGSLRVTVASDQVSIPTAATLVPQTLCSGVTSAMTGTTSTSVIGATASNYIYITQITVANSHATVGTIINFQDGNGGTTIYSVPAAAVYGGATITFPKDAPLKVPTAGNALYCANVTTGANTYVSASGWKSTVSY